MDFGLSGISSGIDTESLIQQLVQLRQKPLYTKQDKVTEYQNEKSEYSTFNSKISSVYSKMAVLESEDLFETKNAASSNEDVFTATATKNATESSYSIVVTNLAKANAAASDQVADIDAALGAWAGFDFELNGKVVTLTEDTDLGGGNVSLASIRDDINNTTNVGLTASIIDRKLVLTNDDTGASNAITFDQRGVSGYENVLANIGITLAGNNNGDLSSGSGLVKNLLTDAEDASFKVNGVAVTNSENSGINDVIPEITINLVGLSDDQNDDGTPDKVETLTVTGNDSAISDAVNEFVTEVNNLINYVDEVTGAGGTLEGDRFLQRTVSQLKSYISEGLDDASFDVKTFYELGVEQADYVKGETTNLTFSSSTFSAKFASDPDGVKAFFTNSTDDGDAANGMVKTINDYLNELTKSGGMIDIREDTMDDKIESAEEQVTKYQEYLDNYEEYLTNKFQKMEESMAMLNGMSSSISQQLSGLSSS